MTSSNRHRAEVTEVYENGLRAAVKFLLQRKARRKDRMRR